MISPDNLSIEQLQDAFAQADVNSVDIENGLLKVRMHDQAFTVAVIGPHQVRFFRPSAVSPRPDADAFALLSAANSLNSDLALVAGAYVSEDGEDLIYTQALSVSGGVSEWNVATALLEFAVETALFDQIVEKAIG